MLTRLTHAAIAFAITVVVYQMYVLTVVPFVDPSFVGAAAANAATDEQRTQAREAVHKHRELLGAYFPEGHWTLAKPPITFESGKIMFVIDDYQPNDNGQVRVEKCAILFFPRPRERGQPPPRDTVILEAPHGAFLQMDQGVRKSGLGGFGRIQWGQLMGDITVRSDMHDPGPEDDLLLTARDVTLNEDLIRTESKVELRLGPHWGRGRQLEIRLVAIERAQSHDSQSGIGGIDSLEIKYDVEAQFSPGTMQVFGDQKQPSTQGATATASPPVKITSQGSFKFDFPSQIASFSEQVELKQLYPTGQLDQLLCNKLQLYFVKQNNPLGETTQALGKFLPGMIEATGTDSELVTFDSQSQGATARGQRLRIEVQSRRVTLDQGHEVMATLQGSEIHARQLRYQMLPAGSAQKIGTFQAEGHGWLKVIAADRPTQKPFEVRWLESMRLDRVDGKPVLTLHGRPQLEMVGMGRLWADGMKLYLRERDVTNANDLLPADVVPERMVADGQVAVKTAELSGNINHLDVQINYEASNFALGQPDGSGSQTNQLTRGKPGGRVYDVAGDQLKILLTVRAGRPEVTSLDLDGSATDELEFRETTAHDTTTQPLEVVGNTLHVENVDQPNAVFTLHGQPAMITAAGMSIRAATLRLNRSESKAWIDSPGELQLPMKKDFSGRPLGGLNFLVVRWQGGMKLERDVVSFHGKVIANTNDGSLGADQMFVTLSEPIRFDGAAQQRQTELAQLECRGKVNAEFTQRDEFGIVSVQNMNLRSFIANQQTGQLSGEGPGSLESVHLASSSSKIAGFGDVVPPNAQARQGAQASQHAQARQGLRFLRVEFKRKLHGNLHRRQVEVTGDANAIYGPVDAWHQKLSLSVRSNPGPETILITSEKLGIAESPMAGLKKTSGLGPIELMAEGSVNIEANLGQRGTVNAVSHKARYDQLKTMFVLEGDGRVPAKMYLEERVGAPVQEVEASRIWYNYTTGEGGTDGFSGGKFKQIGTGRR